MPSICRWAPGRSSSSSRLSAMNAIDLNALGVMLDPSAMAKVMSIVEASQGRCVAYFDID